MSRGVTLAGFVGIAAAMAALQLIALVWRRVATAGSVVRAIAHPPAGRWLLVAGWLWLGWHIFVRARHG